MSPVVNMHRTYLFNEDIESARFRSISPALRGHWVMLQAYCSRRANGGVIQGARNWDAAMWRQILPGGNKNTCDQLVAKGLAKWGGPGSADLEVWGYSSWNSDSREQRRHGCCRYHHNWSFGGCADGRSFGHGPDR